MTLFEVEGVTPPDGMDFIASRTEMTFWCLWSSPLMVATDPRHLSADKRAILMNPEAIAVNQDPLATAGDMVRNASRPPEGQLWARELAGGEKAVVLLNPWADHGALALRVDWAELGWPAGAAVAVRDLWAREDLGVFAAGWNRSVGARDVAFLRLTLQKDKAALVSRGDAHA
jgi:alpha-galactosidase